MKKVLVVVLALLMVLSCVACGEEEVEPLPYEDSIFLGTWTTSYYEINGERYDKVIDNEGAISYCLSADGSCIITKGTENRNATWKESEAGNSFIIIDGTTEMEFISLDTETFVYEAEETCILVDKTEGDPVVTDETTGQ